MSPRRVRSAIPALLLLTALVALPAGFAQDGAAGGPAEAPADASTSTIGNVTVAAWVVDANGTLVQNLTAGDAATLRVLLENGGAENVTVALNASVDYEGVTLGGDRNVTLAANATETVDWSFTLPEDAPEGTATLSLATTVAGVGPNGTAPASQTVTYAIQVQPAPLPPLPPEEGPSLVVLGGAAAVLLVATGGAYALMKRQRPKPKPRSATLQRMELERQAERAKTAEQKQEIHRVIQESEEEKARARDLQILQAKRQDAAKMIELIRKRKEAGQLTELQYQKLLEKKQADLDRIEQEIAQIESS